MEAKQIFDINKQMIMQYVSFNDEDMEILDNSINELISNGIGTINEIEPCEAYPWIYAMQLLTDENKSFYIEISEHGTLLLLTENNPQGEVIYAFLSNDVTIPEKKPFNVENNNLEEN